MDLSQLDSSKRSAVETLHHPGFFALGGVGTTSCISAGERALDRLIIDPQAAVLFRLILDEGSYEGKLYALVGLRTVDHAGYLHAVARFRNDQTPVETMSGCLRGPFPMADEIRQLEGWPPV